MRIPRSLVVTVVALLPAPLVTAQTASNESESARRIAVWGSSVANGAGDESQRGGYAGRLETLLEPRGWVLFNQSRGGDSTVTIRSRFEPGEAPDPDTEYLTTVDPAYVLIGLSLGNEGIAQCRLGQTRGCTSTSKEAD
ncbi:MAG: hypothetical protein OEM60_13295, partial [Gammaproteobacteria bacterium]|nr:hypothetical protein [Gammaproteobacteria bacterium]